MGKSGGILGELICLELHAGHASNKTSVVGFTRLCLVHWQWVGLHWAAIIYHISQFDVNRFAFNAQKQKVLLSSLESPCYYLAIQCTLAS